MTAFYSARKVKAVRKQRDCRFCCEPVEVGQPAVTIAGLGEDFFHAALHPECHEALSAFFKRNEDWPDEPQPRGGR